MTRPEVVSFLGGAVAIVTDEGGITCHAAIIAREMNKPCIIGTKIATQVLHGGDLVEVDADNGVVRVLERAEKESDNLKLLENTFSREKKLYYFDLWDYCDKESVKKYFGDQMENNLFIVLPKGQKGSVWHEKEEMSRLREIAVRELSRSGDTWKMIQTDAQMAWSFLRPYAEGQEIVDPNEWKKYQKHLLLFWTAMNSVVWEAIDDPKVSEQVRNEFIALREDSERFVERTSVLATDFFEKYAPEWKELSHVLTFQEMVSIVENDGSVQKEDIASRSEGCFLFKGMVYSDLNRVDEILRSNGFKRNTGEQGNDESLTGVIAYTGRVSGYVKVINGKQEIGKIEVGDVLVTQMTSPDYIPAIKKSVALITDEGGSLCHAAIISRELKKPCVIGTKIATQVLHDGDLVEVDANHGVVKILKRANPIENK